MRTTVTLDPDADAIVRRLMRERGLTFKAALNEAIRAAATSPGRRPRFSTPTFDMGRPAIPLDHALRIAGELEDDELRRRVAARK